MKLRERLLLFLLTAPVASATTSQSPAEGERPARGEETTLEWREGLLDLAFTGVSGMPLDPHVKNRARAQEKVVQACLRLGRVERATVYADGITNWRRGACYADLAYHRVERGEVEGIDELLAQALELVEEGEGAREQAWRRDRVKAKVARAFLLLGEGSKADQLQLGMSHSEVGRVEEVRARMLDSDQLEAHLARLDGVVERGSFEQVQAALLVYVTLYDRFYDEPDRRALVEQRVLGAKDRVPRTAGVSLLLDLARHACGHGGHGGHEQALELIAQARDQLDSTTWDPEQRTSMLARIATIRFLAGQRTEALGELDAAVAQFKQDRERVINIYRAAVLCDLAEAYQAVGEEAAAHGLYAEAIEEGVVNPNSRPRATNLAETLCSMATHGVRPDEALLERIHEVHAALGSPW